MPLELSPLHESELDVYIRIATAAFKDTLVGRIKAPSLTPERFQISWDANITKLSDPRFHYLKVVDSAIDASKDENRGIIAVAKWVIYPKGRTEKELDEAEQNAPEPLPDSCAEAEKDFRAYLNKWRRNVMGTKPIACKWLSR
jgi:hypothetical protein